MNDLIKTQPTAYDKDKVMMTDESTTTLVDYYTECCGYGCGLDNEKVNYCPVCGKKIVGKY